MTFFRTKNVRDLTLLEIPRIYANSIAISGSATKRTGWCSAPTGNIELSDGTTTYTSIKPYHYYNGATLIIPGKANEKLLSDGNGNWNTTSNFKVTCLTDDTFLVRSPDGLKYTFNKRVSKIVNYSYSFSYYMINAYALVTLIEDRFGTG